MILYQTNYTIVSMVSWCNRGFTFILKCTVPSTILCMHVNRFSLLPYQYDLISVVRTGFCFVFIWRISNHSMCGNNFLIQGKNIRGKSNWGIDPKFSKFLRRFYVFDREYQKTTNTSTVCFISHPVKKNEPMREEQKRNASWCYFRLHLFNIFEFFAVIFCFCVTMCILRM